MTAALVIGLTLVLLGLVLVLWCACVLSGRTTPTMPQDRRTTPDAYKATPETKSDSRGTVGAQEGTWQIGEDLAPGQVPEASRLVRAGRGWDPGAKIPRETR